MALQRRRLGRTNHESSIAILGGAAFWASTTAEARPAFELALARGVNHIDIAPQYGEAQAAAGPLVAHARDQLFVAAKTLRANPNGVVAQFDDSRRLLGSDILDLYQAHAVTSIDELDRRGPAIERILGLREERLCKFAGITGHDLTAPTTFIEALRRYDLDTVMFPVYPRLWADDEYREAAEELLALCAERDLGVMAIKAAARRPWSDGQPLTAALADDPSTGERWAGSWYEPQPPGAALEDGIRFALSTPGVHAFCTPGDIPLLAPVLDAAEAYRPMSADERAAAVDAMRDERVIFPIPR
jgi:aryl-alcohol dehydrogenase-like predicted oxidoreductase